MEKDILIKRLASGDGERMEMMRKERDKMIAAICRALTRRVG